MKYPQLVSMPSAVSDWLEEQLEARGIDAVVYTRYILSLLHTDSIDVILQDEELHFSQLKKEIKQRSNGNRKRIRRSTEWSKNVDPERIKRLAAVECLMSASEQTFGIETLVDELCEKLKAIKSENSTSSPINNIVANPSLSKTNLELQQQQQQNCVISPQELAKRYYAAFPPLSRNNKSINSPTKLITLAPKWIPSPIKQKKSLTNRKIKKNNNINHNHNNNKDDKIVNMKARSTIIGNKQRYNNYFNRNDNNLMNRKDVGRNLMKSVEGMNQWDLSLFINNNNNNNKNSKLTNIINNIEISSTTTSSITDEHCLNNEWNIEDDLNMYEDLPVDISDLLDDSPSLIQNDETVELMNIANMRDTGKRGFIQNGTNLTTSIWSNDNSITTEFNSITINTNNDWIIKNDNNDNTNDNQDWNYILPNEKWSEIDDNNSNNPIVLSLIKLNHNKETSPFVEVCPKPKQHNLFKQVTNNGNLLQNTPVRTIEIDPANKDDLLTSTTSHFRPIKEPINHNNNTINNNCNNLPKQYEYSDGTTFTISRNFDQINYRRTKSGGLYLENDYAMKRKYYEYHNNIHNNYSNLATIPTTTTTTTTTTNYGFVLKFIVCQNDKECQTDDFIVGVTQIQETIINNISNNNDNDKGSYHINNSDNDKKCICLSNEKMQQAMITSFIICPQHSQFNDKSLMAEIIWKKQDNNSVNINNNNNDDDDDDDDRERVCEKCTKSVMWNTECKMLNFNCNGDDIWDDKNLHNIWSGGEICYSCLGRPPSTLQQTKLREDISQDGDQLLSDLSSLQRSYMMENNELNTTTTKTLETSYDINELLLSSKDKKRHRRHSLIMAINNNNNTNNIINSNNDNTIDESGIWSFASRLEEDCLIQMSTIPTLRSVTL